MNGSEKKREPKRRKEERRRSKRQKRKRSKENNSGLLVGVEQRLKKDRAFPNVNEEGIGRPTANELDKRGRDTMFRKGSGASGSHGLSSSVTVEETSETGNEEVPSGDRSLRSEPKRRRQWKSTVARVDVLNEASERVDVGVLFLFDNDSVALKELVSFVAR